MGIFTKKFNAKISFLLVSFIVLTSLSPLFATKTKAFGVLTEEVPGPLLFAAIDTAIAADITAGATAFSAGVDAYMLGKESVGDSLAWIIVNLIIERMAASTVKWINSGFKGKPAYVTNPQSYFTDLGDKIAGKYILGPDSKLNFLCGPISAKVKLALKQNYIQEPQWQCTISQAGKNITDFMNDFEKGGWDSFFELTQKRQNNPIGAFLQAENELDLQIASKQGTKQKELDWGNGFLSWETCEERDPDDGVCIGRADIATPGSVIQENLNGVLGIGNQKLAVADEINEIVSALLNQLIYQVVGGIGKGLRGLTSGGGQSNPLDDQLSANSTDAKKNSYFQQLNNTMNPLLNNAATPPTGSGIDPTTLLSCDPLDPSYDPSNPNPFCP